MQEIVEALILSFGIVFIAELGDKSQLLAVLFTTRYHPGLVLGGIAIASGVVHVVSVGAGSYLGDSLDPRATTIAAGLALLACGVWGLREKIIDTDHSATSVLSAARKPLGWGSLATVISAFVLAELGDKTMFATVALGARHSFVGVWAGSTAGMVAADALAIAVGAGLAKKISPQKLASLANLVFVAVGAWYLMQGIYSYEPLAGMATFIVLSVAGGVAAIYWRSRRSGEKNLAHRADKL